MDIRKRFGKRIKELRQARGLSQEALARFGKPGYKLYFRN